MDFDFLYQYDTLVLHFRTDAMKTITLRKIENQYRTIQVKLESFPDDIRPKDYALFGYLNGERINRIKDMTLFSFDLVIYLKNSLNLKNEIEFIHCLGWRNDTNLFTPIILKRK